MLWAKKRASRKLAFFLVQASCEWIVGDSDEAWHLYSAWRIPSPEGSIHKAVALPDSFNVSCTWLS
jgi:hypothetical protein